MKYNISKKNDFSLATITDNKSTTVTAFISIDIHQRNSLTKQTVERLYPEALLSGTQKLTRQKFLDKINLLGASIDILLSSGSVLIIINSTSETFSKILVLLEDMFLNPAFSKIELDRVKTTTINELHAEKENTREIAQEKLANTFYDKKDRRFTCEIEDIISRIPEITPKELKDTHKEVLSQFWTCSIAGKKIHATEIDKFISKIKNSNPHKDKESFHKQKPATQKLILKHIPSRQNIDFSIGVPIPITLRHPDYIPLFFAINVLGKWGGFAGRLMSTVRELEGLTYGIYAKTETFSSTEYGYCRIMTFFAPDKTIQGIKSTYREIEKFYKKGITKDELSKFKTILNTQETLLQDSIFDSLKQLHTYHHHKFSLEEMKEHKSRIALLELAEVNNIIKKYFNPRNLTISGAGPIKAVEKDLKAFIKNY